MVLTTGVLWMLTSCLWPGPWTCLSWATGLQVQVVTVMVATAAALGHCCGSISPGSSEYVGWTEPQGPPIAFHPQPSLWLWSAEFQEAGEMEARSRVGPRIWLHNLWPGLCVPDQTECKGGWRVLLQVLAAPL